MIHRGRNQEPRPPSLDPTRNDSPGRKELRSAEEWFEGRLAKRPEFKAYKGKDVGPALEKLFFRKCAYCESPYAVTQPVDIEHWRPKAEIDEVPKAQGGYWWLAMEWENLLPSCIDCNRARNQIVPDQQRRGGWIQRKVGKGNQFPLSKPSRRWNYRKKDEPEDPLLLNPCEDNPSEYFDFHPSGVLLPKARIPQNMRLRAETSIRVYALNRKGLVDERLRHILRLEPIFALVRFLYKASSRKDLPQDHRDAIDALVVETLDRLRETCEPEVPYSQFLKQRVEIFLKRELGA